MATTLPQFAQRKLARKTSDITRLTDEFKRNANAVSDQYQSSFAEYQAKRDAIMAPYQEAVAKYQNDYKTYEDNLAGYKTRLTDYQKRLQSAVDTPLIEVPTSEYKRQGIMRYGTRLQIDGTWYSAGDGSVASDLPEGYTYENGKLFRANNPGKFEEAAPKAPDAPTAPTVEEFDTKQFDTKRAELETGLKRELGERRAARASAVSRKAARPLLQGA